MKITNKTLYNRLESFDSYKNHDECVAELKISDGINAFLSNPKVKEFYKNELRLNSCLTEKTKGISTTIMVDYKGNTLNVNHFDQDLSLTDIDVSLTSPNFFEPSFKSINNYFFGNKFTLETIRRYYFYFKGNKIILYIKCENSNDMAMNRYFCVVSFQQKLVRQDIVELFTNLICVNMDTVKNTDDSKKIKVLTYADGELSMVKPCDLQIYILKYIDHVDLIFERYHELLEKSGIKK